MRLRQDNDLGGVMSKKFKPIVLRNGKARSERLRKKMLHERPDTVRSMKKSRQDDIIALSIAFIELCCLQLEGIAVALAGDGTARPITVPELTRMAQLEQRTCERCLEDMKNMGLINVTKQIITRIDRGQVVITMSSVLRSLTPKFWAWLDLLEDFRRAVQWAKSKAKTIKLRRPIYRKTCTCSRNIYNGEQVESTQESLACLKCRNYIKGKPCSSGLCPPSRYQACMNMQRLGAPAIV